MRRHAGIRWIVAALLALAAIAPIASWWLSLGSERGLNAVSSHLETVFAATNPDRSWFVAWAVLPVALILGAFAYASPLAVRRPWAWSLAVALAVVTLFCLINMPSVGLLLVIAVAFAVLWAYGA